MRRKCLHRSTLGRATYGCTSTELTAGLIVQKPSTVVRRLMLALARPMARVSFFSTRPSMDRQVACTSTSMRCKDERTQLAARLLSRQANTHLQILWLDILGGQEEEV